jgi:DNA-binding response OmpR family regulator
MSTNLEELRAKLSALQAARVDTLDAPAAPSEISARLRVHFEQTATDRAGTVRRTLAAGEFDSLFRVPARPGAVDITPALLGVFTVDELMQRMKPHLSALPAGMTKAARRTKLAEIDAEILSIEHAEMDCIEALERDGVAFTLRADMTPAVYLRVARS